VIEVELKSVVDDPALRRRNIEQAGAMLTFEGRLEDRRYDTADRSLGARDHVLRLRTYRSKNLVRAELDWKGPTRVEGGYKLREELEAPLSDPAALALILERLGYEVTTCIDRDITQYDFAGTTVRFERYPRMDVLVEVEGMPSGIEQAITVLGLPRRGFSTDRLGEFVGRFEARTGTHAATCDADLAAMPDDG